LKKSAKNAAKLSRAVNISRSIKNLIGRTSGIFEALLFIFVDRDQIKLDLSILLNRADASLFTEFAGRRGEGRVVSTPSFAEAHYQHYRSSRDYISRVLVGFVIIVLF
jgi:hypothetical protein